jgi:Domain of unknown function (DUF5615)
MSESLNFYTDKHIPKQVAIQLRERGVNVVRCEEVGMGDAKDIQHLSYAVEHGYAMVSLDTDFQDLHAKWLMTEQAHRGIFCISKHLQGKKGIGKIVNELWDYHQMVELGAGTLNKDIHDHIFYIR